MPTNGEAHLGSKRPHPFSGLFNIRFIPRPASLALLGGENKANGVFYSVPPHLFQGLG